MRNEIIHYGKHLKQFARNLRNKNTLSEVLLWKQIKGKALGIEFHRQVPIDRYIVDFYCHEIKLAIEIDGGSHNMPGMEKRDAERQKRLESLGVRFIRFEDMQVKKDMQNVLRALEITIESL